MSDLRLRFAEAAFEALKEGGHDTERVIDRFREISPLEIRLPSDPMDSDRERIRELISLAAEKAVLVYGEETTGFVSTVALGKNQGKASFGASGFLISPDIVLTAGHCIDEGLTGGVWIQNLGMTELLKPMEGRFEKHWSFGLLSEDPEPFRNDIGMLRLEKPATDVEIYPIADSTTIDQAKNFRIVGYGNDENGAFSPEIKRTALVSIRLNPSDGTLGYADLEFVIGDPLADDGDACERDSGGPVLVEVAGHRRLAGLISRGVNPNKTECGDGTICVRLDRYVDWIDETIERLEGEPRPQA